MIAKCTFLAIALSILMLAPPAFAQSFQKTNKDDQQQGQTKGPPERRPGEPEPLYVDEKAYNSAVDRIPDKGLKYDPWGNVREKPTVPEKPAAKR